MVFADALEWIYQTFVGRPIVLEEDNFTTMVRKIIAVIFGVATLFGGGSPYYGYRALRATNSTNPEDAPFQGALIALAASLFVFAFFMCLPVCLFVYCTKTAPDWILQYCIVMTVITTIMWDVATVYFPIRATSLALAFVSIGSSLPQSKIIVVLLAIYYLIVEARDAWDITDLRIQPPYEGGPIERFVTSLTGFFSLVMCSGLMGGMLFQYTVLLEGAAQSIELAKSVAGYLLMYDTDMVAEELKTFEERNGLIRGNKNGKNDDAPILDENGNVIIRAKTDEGGNRRNKELVEVFREMSNNLVRYRPHLPDYVLKVHEDDSNEFGNSDGAGNNSQSTYHINTTPRRNNRRLLSDPLTGGRAGRTLDDEEMSEGNLSYSTDSESRAGGMSAVLGGSSTSDPHSSGAHGASPLGSRRVSQLNAQTLAQVSKNYNQQQQQLNNPSNHPMNNNNDNVSIAMSLAGGNKKFLAAKTQKTQAMFAGMLKGAQHENVIVARLDFERFITVLMDGAAESEFLSPRINAMVSKILENAFITDGTVHSFIEDSLVVSWNATRRANQTEYKCCKFLVEVKNHVYQTIKSFAPVNASHVNNSFNSPSFGSGYVFPGTPESNNNNNNNNNTNTNNTNTNNNNNNTNNTVKPSNNSLVREDSPNLGQTVASNTFSFNSLNHQTSILSVAAVSGTAWCQIAGSDKKQFFALSKFSSTEALKKMSEFARKYGFLAIDQQIQSRARVEFTIQGCGTVSCQKPENNIFFDQQQHRLNTQNNYTKGIMQNAMRMRRKSTITMNVKTPINNNLGPATTTSPSNPQFQVVGSDSISPPLNHLHGGNPGIAVVMSGSTSMPATPPLLPHQHNGGDPLSPSGSDVNRSGSNRLNAPPPFERRNTAKFPREHGWTSELADKAEEDTGRMVLTPETSNMYLSSRNTDINNYNNNNNGPTSPKSPPEPFQQRHNGSSNHYNNNINSNEPQPEYDAVIMGNVNSSSSTTTGTNTNSQAMKAAIATSLQSASVTPTEINNGLSIAPRNYNNNNNNQNHNSGNKYSIIGGGGISPTSVGSIELNVQQPNALTAINPIYHAAGGGGRQNVSAGGFGAHTANSNSGGTGAAGVPNANNTNATPNKTNSNSALAENNLNTSALQQYPQHVQVAMANQLNLYRNTYLVSVYELVGWKVSGASSGEDDEWLYQVQDKDMLNGSLIDATNFLTKGQTQAAEAVMNRLRQEMPDVEFTSQAFRSIVECVEEMKMRQKLLNQLQNNNTNSNVVGGLG